MSYVHQILFVAYRNFLFYNLKYINELLWECGFMKFNFKGDIAKILSGVEELSANLNIEIDSSGIPVMVKNNRENGLSVSCNNE